MFDIGLNKYDMEKLKVCYFEYIRQIMANAAKNADKAHADKLDVVEIGQTAIEVGLFLTYIENIIKENEP